MLERPKQGAEKQEPRDNGAAVAPSISLPKGGGAIRGMGEKFTANPVTGTGSMSVPIGTSPGRSGFGPQLALSCDSGAGSGPFGFGWTLSLPAITRKTDKGLPQYFDADDPDVFILSGAEDLVPVLNPNGTKFEDPTSVLGYTIHRYRARIEGYAPSDTRLRLIEHVRTSYLRDDLTGPLALEEVESLALLFESYRLAFTPELAQQYEPFFDDTHEFKFGKQVGVSPILLYDPVDRVVATLYPNHTYQKVVFGPWQQKTCDANDTVALDPRTDPDVAQYVAKYFEQVAPQVNDWKTWLQQRGVDLLNPPQDSPSSNPETKAAVRTLPHADTPTIACFDTLGRTFLTIAHNRKGATGLDEFYPTRVVLYIEGNQRSVTDALDRIVMTYDYDMLGNRIHQASMETGERWMLNDVTSKPIRAWNSRGYTRHITYDELRRPTGLFVTDNGGERLAERTVYGESQGAADNHRACVFQVFDAAGVVISEAYDFKGNLKRSRRDLLPDYKGEVDWQLNPAPSDGTFTTSTTYDALNRPTTVTAPDSSTYRPTYNEANLLDKVEVSLRGAMTRTPFVTGGSGGQRRDRHLRLQRHHQNRLHQSCCRLDRDQLDSGARGTPRYRLRELPVNLAPRQLDSGARVSPSPDHAIFCPRLSVYVLSFHPTRNRLDLDVQNNLPAGMTEYEPVTANLAARR
jgi:Salmonella virulence plasmid 65kDa B protein